MMWGCRYSLEGPHRDGSNEYLQFMFRFRELTEIVLQLSSNTNVN